MKPPSLELVQEGGLPPAFEVDAPQPTVDELAGVLDREANILLELRDALERQCGHVAANDVAAVNASVDDIGRLLLALEETRRHRRATMARLTGGAGSALATALDARGAGDIATRRSRLRHAALEAARAAAVNRAVLRRALEAGDSFLQALFSSAADPCPAYGPGERRDRSGASGLLLNRRA